MAYGVVVCSKCRKAKVFEVGRKTTTCGVCGRTLQLRLHTVHHRADTAEDARHAAGLLNARSAGREDEYLEAMLPLSGDAAPEPRDPVSLAARKARGSRGEAAKAEAAARALGAFTREEFEAALAGAGVDAPRAERLLERLLHSRVVYEPRAGHYRTT